MDINQKNIIAESAQDKIELMIRKRISDAYALKLAAISHKEATKIKYVTKLTNLIIEKIRFNIMYDLTKMLEQEPKPMCVSGSDTPLKLWKELGLLDKDEMIKKTEGLKEAPLNEFLTNLSSTINQTTDINRWVNNIENDEDLENKANELLPQVTDKYVPKVFGVQTLETEHFVYMGNLNNFKKPDGFGRMICSDNSIHEGVFKNGQPHGYGRNIMANGSVYVGSFNKGLRSGKGCLTDKDGTCRNGCW